MSNALDTPIRRSPKDKGNQITITVVRYDNGYWQVNGEPCEDRAEADHVVGLLVNKVEAA